MAIHDRDFDDERCKNCSVNAKCYACDIYFEGLKRYKNLKKEEQKDGANEIKMGDRN